MRDRGIRVRNVFFVSLLLYPLFPCSLVPLSYGEPLVDIQAVDPTIAVDIRYATKDNFLGEVLYPVSRCLLRRETAVRLAGVQADLRMSGLGLKVWDCYRPLSIQKKLWQKKPDERYVANPAKGSRHNRGAAVDLTLVDARGMELAMPTGYDDFSEKAHRGCKEIGAEALKNTRFLEDAMKRRGFIGLDTEWWHFDSENWKNYELMDMPIEPLKEIAAAGQLIVVAADNWDSPKAGVYLFERRADGWRRVKRLPAVIGRKGMAWGIGLHPSGMAGPQKKEGDFKTPAGVFSLGRGYGYEGAGPQGSGWPYQEASERLRCVDDPKSKQYNRVVEETKDKDWNSAEIMRRNDEQYQWVIVVRHNDGEAGPVSGMGSCIFFHVWKDRSSSTAGCTALKAKHIELIFKWLDPALSPVAVHLPKEVYQDAQGIWNLPDLD